MPGFDKAGIDRVRRIEGQVWAITIEIVDERYCIDNLHQFGAVKPALPR